MDSLKTINIFRNGTFTAMAGQTLTFSENDVQRMAAAYNEATRPAPLVLGHPEHDSPAYGVIKSLFAKGGALYAVASVSSTLIDLVKAGRYGNVSAAFMAPNAPNNPTPGSWYLRHLGFLGAMAPAVKGLAPLAFSEGDAVCFGEALTVDFAQAPDVVSNRQAFHEAAQALMRSTPGMSYAAAACKVEQRYQDSQISAQFASSMDVGRAAQHKAILNCQASVPGMTYAEAVGRMQAAGMRM